MVDELRDGQQGFASHVRENVALSCLDWNVWVIEEGCVCCLHCHVVWEFDNDSLGTWLFVGAMRICTKEVTCATRVCDGAVV